MDTRNNLVVWLVLATLMLFGCKSDTTALQSVAVEPGNAAAPRGDRELRFFPADEFENPCERGFGSFCGDTSTDLWLRIHGAQPRVVAGDFMFIGYPEDGVRGSAGNDNDNEAAGGESSAAAFVHEAGFVRLYERTEEANAGVQFRGEYQLTPPMAFDHFGKQLAGTEEFVAVSAPSRNTCDEARCTQAGAVYLLERSDEGDAWRDAAVLTPSDRLCYDRFGTSMLASERYLFANAPNKATCSSPEAGDAPGRSSCVVTGAVYVFEKDQKTGKWKESGIIKPPEPDIFEFGEHMWLKESWLGLGSEQIVIDATRGRSCPNWEEAGERSKPSGARVPQLLGCEKREGVSFVYERDESGAWVNVGTTDDNPEQLQLGQFDDPARLPTLEEGEEPGRCD